MTAEFIHPLGAHLLNETEQAEIIAFPTKQDDEITPHRSGINVDKVYRLAIDVRDARLEADNVYSEFYDNSEKIEAELIETTELWGVESESEARLVTAISSDLQRHDSASGALYSGRNSLSRHRYTIGVEEDLMTAKKAEVQDWQAIIDTPDEDPELRQTAVNMVYGITSDQSAADRNSLHHQIGAHQTTILSLAAQCDQLQNKDIPILVEDLRLTDERLAINTAQLEKLRSSIRGHENSIRALAIKVQQLRTSFQQVIDMANIPTTNPNLLEEIKARKARP